MTATYRVVKNRLPYHSLLIKAARYVRFDNGREVYDWDVDMEVAERFESGLREDTKRSDRDYDRGIYSWERIA